MVMTLWMRVLFKVNGTDDDDSNNNIITIVFVT